jgi:hypothetical protein
MERRKLLIYLIGFQAKTGPGIEEEHIVKIKR